MISAIVEYIINNYYFINQYIWYKTKMTDNSHGRGSALSMQKFFLNVTNWKMIA